MVEENRYFHRFTPGDPMRIEWRARQVERVRAYGEMARKVHSDPDRIPAEQCSCQEYIYDMVKIIEDLHKKIDVLDPDSVKP